MEGQRIGNYRVVRKIGQGGMGSVWEAKHEQLHRKAAIKLLRRELSADPQLEVRFFNEAKAASRVDHPSIVKIDEFGHLPDGTAYIIMEFLSGDPLSVRLRNLGGKLQLPDILRISRQIASALAATHSKGIVHRDLMLAFFPSPSAQVFLWGESGGKDAVLILFLATDVKREKGNFPS